MNTTAKEVLNYQTPFDVFFGRAKNMSSVKSHVAKSSKRCADRNQRYLTTVPSHYEINEKVLIRYPTRKSRIPSKRYVLRANVLERNLRKHRYLVEFRHPKSGNVNKEWIGVENITSVTREAENRKQAKKHTCKISNKKVHRQKYLIPFLHGDRLDAFEAYRDMKVAFDPPGNGNCQFEALAHQLAVLDIHISASKLRKDVVQHLKSNWNGPNGYGAFISCPSTNYLTSMSKEGTYGDHLTLVAVAREFNTQILVMSTDGIQHSRIISNDGNYDPALCLLTLGYFPEGKGEHYVSLSIPSPTLSDILDNLNILEDNNSNDSPQDLENHETDKNNHIHDKEILGDYEDTGSNHAKHGEDSLSDDDNNNEGIEEPPHENHQIDNRCNIGDTSDMQSGTNPFSQETMPRVNIENSNDSSEGEPECTGDIGRIDHEATLLPVEIWEKIIHYAIDMFPETRNYLRDVNKLFRNIVDRTALPKLYISYNVLPAIPRPVSVRRLIRVSGRGSGLIIEVRRILRSPNWCNAWLFLSEIENRWFELRKIWYRKK